MVGPCGTRRTWLSPEAHEDMAQPGGTRGTLEHDSGLSTQGIRGHGGALKEAHRGHGGAQP